MNEFGHMNFNDGFHCRFRLPSSGKFLIFPTTTGEWARRTARYYGWETANQSKKKRNRFKCISTASEQLSARDFVKALYKKM